MVNVNIPLNLKLGVDTKAQSSQIKQSIESTLERVKKEVLDRYYLNIKIKLLSAEVQGYFIEKTIGVLEDMQADYWGSGAAAEEDPTNVGRGEYKQAVAAEIRRNFAIAASKVSPMSELDLVLLSDEFIGIGSEGDIKGTSPIQWLVYFLVGALETDLIWVNQETYAIFKGGKSASSLGRFGVGELWQMDARERAIRDAQLKKAGKPGIDTYIHPQSGRAGKNWFDGVLTAPEVKLLVVDPALQEAIAHVQSRIGSIK